MADLAFPATDGQVPSSTFGWLEATVAGRRVAVVGDVGDELVLVVRRVNTARLEFVAPQTLGADAPPDVVRADFDVVLIAVDGTTDADELVAAEALVRPGGRVLVVVAGHDDHAVEPSDPHRIESLDARVEHVERRRNAVLAELVQSEQALGRAQELADAAQTELLLMRRTFSWRVTGPLRWIRGRAGTR